MKNNWLKYLGLLGLIGLLGLFTDNVGFYGFFGFFGFFGFTNIKHDERLTANINKAARNAFVISLLVSVLTIILIGILGDPVFFVYGFVVNFLLLIMVFTFSFSYYDKKGE